MSSINLPTEYVIKKFYEYGFGVQHIKSNGTFHCSCPICMEGKSFGKKKRCWYIPSKNLIYCHNCGWSSRPVKWIMEAGNISFADIQEELKSGEYTIINLDKKRYDDINFDSLIPAEESILPTDSIDLSNNLQLEYYKNNSVVQKALNYIKSRRLDSAINKPDSFYISLNDSTHKNRLIIPFNDANGKTIFYQSRSIGASFDEKLEKVKYLGKKNAQKSIFGLDKIDSSINEIFIFEGPIDACFVKNGIAVAGINPSSSSSFNELQLQQLRQFADNHSFIWVLDSQWVDEASRQKTAELLSQGESIFMWPETIGKQFKDFNELCVNVKKNEVPIEAIRNNILSGERSLLKYKMLMGGY